MLQHGNTHFDKVYYRRFHRDYDKKELDLYIRWFSGWIGFLDRYLPLKKGDSRRVLEVGCSIGAFARILEKRGFKVIATDISSFIIKRAKRLQKGVDFRTLNIEKEISIPGAFDYIFALEALEHLENPEKALLNIKKKLKKGGIFIFSTPFPSKASLSDPTHINVHKPQWWLTVGRKTGFKERRLIHATFIPYLYRINSFFSRGFPLRVNMPYINSTCIFFFKK